LLGPNDAHSKTSGIYVRADPTDKAVFDGSDAEARAALLNRRLTEWNAVVNS